MMLAIHDAKHDCIVKISTCVSKVRIYAGAYCSLPTQRGRSSMHRTALRFVLLSLFAFCCVRSADNALASFHCEHQGDAPVPILACKSALSSDVGSEAWVSLRKMPAWGTNAGLTIIDMCLRDPSFHNDTIDQTMVVSQKISQSEPSGQECIRRYCTDRKRAFSFFINSIPFPVGWAMIQFRLGMETQNFSISCDQFSE